MEDGQSAGPQPALSLAVIVPTLNEAGNVAALVEDLQCVLAHLVWEVIFVDDGSVDGTAEIVTGQARRSPNVRLIRRVGRRGLSSAVLEGMLATTAPVVAVMDGDRQHDGAILPQLHRAVAAGAADLAVATRYGPGGSVSGWTARRLRVSRSATRLAHWATGLRVTDPLSGYFAVRHSLIVEIAPRLSLIGFKVLLDILSSSPRDLRIVEVPYDFGPRATGRSKFGWDVALDYGLLVIEKLTAGALTPRLMKFLMVGGAGLLVHLAILRTVLLATGGWFAPAQATALLLTIAFNFTFNNSFTYAERRLVGTRFWRGLASFYLICGLGAAANLWFSSLVFAAQGLWWLAGATGAIVSAVWNFTASSLLTWRRG